MGQWLGDTDTLGVPQVADALGEFGNTASSVSEDLATRVGGASDLLGALASGTQEVDQSLADRLGLAPSPAQVSQGTTGAPEVPADELFPAGEPGENVHVQQLNDNGGRYPATLAEHDRWEQEAENAEDDWWETVRPDWTR